MFLVPNKDVSDMSPMSRKDGSKFLVDDVPCEGGAHDCEIGPEEGCPGRAPISIDKCGAENVTFVEVVGDFSDEFWRKEGVHVGQQR